MADILIVDDDADIAEMLAEFMESRGNRARVARNGEEGLRELERQLPDLLLLDVEMPLLDGPGMAYRMLLHNCGEELVPILLLSGVVGVEEVAARVGTPYYLPKPYSLQAVTALCNRALSERQAPKPTDPPPLDHATMS